MFDTKFIDDTVKRLSESLPPGLNKFRKDLEKNFRVILQSMLAKLDLVTREEFDVQKKVLTKTNKGFWLIPFKYSRKANRTFRKPFR